MMTIEIVLARDAVDFQVLLYGKIDTRSRMPRRAI